MAKSVVVFCSSSNDVSPFFFSEMDKLGRLLARNQIKIVYGGASLGLMGKMADAALSEGGQVTGVIPQYLAKDGIIHRGLTEHIIVDNLLDRKRKMLELADVAIASPGGIGTIDEITEVIALKQLSEHEKPIVFHNFLEFWDPMLEFFKELHLRNMIRENTDTLWQVAENAEDTIKLIKEL